jgi:hypothetical protein
MRFFAALALAISVSGSVAIHGQASQTTPPAAVPAQNTDVKPADAPKGKHGKVPYTGPTTIITLPPTPMLDEEGKQRLDPDGKPMFNDPVKQQRDKEGHPRFDDKHQPVFQTAAELGYDEHGKKLRPVKVKPPKTVAVSVKSGIFTVDGLPGKAALNYEIKDLKFIYFYAPWIGTAVVSNEPFPGAREQPHAFDDKTLTVTVGEHTFQLTSDNRLLGKKPVSAYVLVDREFKLGTAQPVMGYGTTLRAPYQWPGARPATDTKGVAQAPPLPASLRPVMMLPPCPKGQMRRPVTTAGGLATDQPCVPISSVTNPQAPSTGQR